MQRGYEINRVTWQGIELEVRYERNWLGSAPSDTHPSHLEVKSINPRCTPLPITETGYRSHFVHGDTVDEAGGPVAFFVAWLDEAAKGREWQQHVAARQQLALF